MLKQAKVDGVAPASLNILDGGIQAARDGLWNCSTTLTEGRGTYEPQCRMTAAQVATWGKALGPAGCVLVMWRYDDLYMSRSDNQGAFGDVARALAGLTPKGLRADRLIPDKRENSAGFTRRPALHPHGDATSSRCSRRER